MHELQHIRAGCHTLSLASVYPACRAQCAQQKKCPPPSMPCPMILHLQCSHMGASLWIAHSKLSKTCRCPAVITSKLSSYTLPQTSQGCFMPVRHGCFRTWAL